MAIERFLVLTRRKSEHELFGSALADLGYSEVQYAKSGEDGLKIVEQNHTQLVIVAWEVKPMTAPVFIQKIRSNPRRRHLPFLVVADSVSEEEVQLAKQLGFDNILRHPLDKEAVKQNLADLIKAEDSIPFVEKQLRKIEALLEDDRSAEALSMISTRLTRKGPYYARANTTLAEVWLSIRKLDRADKMVSDALKTSPGFVPALHTKARVLTAKGEHEKSIQILKEMAEATPKNFSTLIGLGAAYLGAGRLEDAKEPLQKVKAMDKDNPDANDELGKVAYQEGNLELATKLLSRSGKGSRLARYFNDVAIAHVNSEDFDRGIQTYQDAIKILTDSAKLYRVKYNLGLAYLKKGEPEKSFPFFCESYCSEPNFEKAYAAIARVSKVMKEKGDELDPNWIKQVKEKRAEFKKAS